MAVSLEELLVEELQDIYDAEKQLVKALPKMAKATASDELKMAITEHLEQTKGHVDRIEQAFSHLEVKAKSKPCAAMKGLIDEGDETAKEDHSDDMKDLAIIGAAQRVEHYEIAAYGTARTFAQTLGLDEVVNLLQETLDEEKAADDKLTEIATAVLEGLPVAAVETEEDESAGTEPRAKGKVKRNAGD